MDEAASARVAEEEAEKAKELEEKRRMDREENFQVMEKIFEPVRKFDVSYADREPVADNRPNFSEKDYSVHRKREFPHVHHPLKSLKKKKKRKDQRKRKKKKKHEVKFTPSLPGVEEDDEPDYSLDSDTSSSSLGGEDSDAPSASIPLIQIDPPKDGEGKKRPAHIGFKPEVGESPTHQKPGLEDSTGKERKGSVPESKKTGVDSPDGHLSPDGELARKLSGSLPGSRKSSDGSMKVPGGGTPRKSSLKNVDLRMAFLNRKQSDHGLPRPSSEDSLRSSPEVAAQEFKVESGYAPEPSRMFESDSDPVVCDRAQQELPELYVADPQGSKVKFSLGDEDEDDHLRETEALMANYDAPANDVAGATPIPTSEEASESEPEQKSKKHKHKHHHHHKRRHHYPQENFNLEDLMDRRHAGSETTIHPGLKRVPTEPDEAALLHLSALDDMKSHRFEDARGIRRHKIRHSAMASIVSIGKADDPRRMSYAPPRMRQFDHSPHDIFVELDELCVGEHDSEWREKARWIKYEEDVEEGAERWGKPHVASLSFHSLLELRRCLEKCAIILDLEANDLTSIVSQTVDQLVLKDQISEDDRSKVFRALLLRHRHIGVPEQRMQRRNALPALNVESLNRLGRRLSSWSPGSAAYHRSDSVISTTSHDTITEETHMHDDKQTAANVVKNFSSASLTRVLGSSASLKGEKDKTQKVGDDPGFTKIDDIHVDIDNNTDDTVSFEVPKIHHSESYAVTRKHHDIMKKIPEGAEAMTVLVGAVDFLDQPIMAFIRLAEGKYLGNLTEVPLPVRFLFILLGPEHTGLDYHEIGRSVSTLMSNKMFHDTAYQADRREDLLSAINVFLDDSIVLPPGDWDRDTLLPITKNMNEVRQRRKKQEKKDKEKKDKEKEKPPDEVDSAVDLLEGEKMISDHDPLRRTKRLFGGLVNDIKCRYPLYLSDIKDGCNAQCLAAFIFIYFACLAPAITFGGLLGEKTNGWMGVGEMFVGVCVSGLVFTFFSGQPLLILGHTGPLLVFEEAMYTFCSSNNLAYMPMRAWIGIWVMIITIVVVMLEGSVLVRYITSFTEEVFATLISLIFIYEVFRKLYVIYTLHPLLAVYPGSCVGPPVPFNNTTDALNGSNIILTTPTVDYANVSLGNQTVKKTGIAKQPNTFLLCVILTLGTFFIANMLRTFRNSHLLGRTARRAIGDFGIPIAIIVMTLLDYLIRDVYTEKLSVPPGIQPTSAERKGWFINPIDGIQVWQIFAAIIPAFLIFILFFMETSITGVIVNKKERKLKKGSGFHLDLFIIGCLNGFCGIFGLPFMTAATVRSVTHVSALTVFSKTHAPGEKPKLVEVKEQRVTNFLVHVLIGISVLMSPVLRQIPIAVLFGVFLYMGVASMSGITLIDRCSLFLMPIKHHPDVDYVKRVRTRKMHLFTFLQVLWLVILWVVKSTPASLGFPFFLLMMIPFRLFLVKYMFNSKELAVLDSGEVEVEDEVDGNDADDEEEQEEQDFYQGSHLPSHPRLSMAHIHHHPSSGSFTRRRSSVGQGQLVT